MVEAGGPPASRQGLPLRADGGGLAEAGRAWESGCGVRCVGGQRDGPGAAQPAPGGLRRARPDRAAQPLLAEPAAVPRPPVQPVARGAGGGHQSVR